MNDLKFAFRQLLKNPGFTAVAVLTLALGIGANTAIFSVINAVLLRPLPYPDSDRLVQIWQTNPRANRWGAWVSYPDFLDWRQQNTTFEEVGAFRPWGFNITDGDRPEALRGVYVSAGLFSVRAAAPDYKGELLVRLVPIREVYAGKLRLWLFLILGASALLLVIACTNVANLFLTRAASRVTELATRIALGAGRANVIRQMATDTDFQSTVFQRPTAGIRSVTPGYFAASGNAVRAGQVFSEQDEIPVALIGESQAAGLWPGEAMTALIGRTFREGDVTGPLITIVGIVADVRPAAADRTLLPQVYRPHHQRPTGRMTVVVRSAQEPAALVAAIRGTIRATEPNLPIPAVRTMTEIVSAAVAQRRFQLLLTSLFAGLALVLGAVGVYGVVSFSVRCRTREIGLRIALGAKRGDVMRWVFSMGLKSAFVGLLIGLGSAVAIATALRNLLFGISPTDPVALGAVVAAMLLASVLACLLPARRAARVDPMVALRTE